jgi:hypothetical protein
MVQTLVLAMALSMLATPSLAAELVYGGGSADCSRLACPPGVNCDILIRPACQRCTADPGKSFVIECQDGSCRSFGKMTCEPARAAAAVPADPVPAECREAKINVDWVITHDEGAKRRYTSLRREGNSPIDAVLGAQAHNPSAQDTIRFCSGWVSSYLASRGMGSGGMGAPPQTQRTPSSCSVDPTNGCARCAITCPEGNAVCHPGSGSMWGDPPRPTCNIQSTCRCYPSR